MSEDRAVISGLLREVTALQSPGHDTILRRFRMLGDAILPAVGAVGGSPARGRVDARLYLDRAALQALLAQAEASPTGRVVVHGLELEAELREAKGGHRYLVVAFEGVPAPEPSPYAGLVRP